MSFDEFWSIYPRRVAKLAAKKAWDRAIKNGSSPDIIIAGAHRYARERRQAEDRYTKHPATWLNGGCWMDDPGANGDGHEQSYAEIADELRNGPEPRTYYDVATSGLAGSRRHKHH